MYLRYYAGRSIRHVGSAIAEAALIVAIGVALVFGVAVVGGSKPAGAGNAFAAKPLSGVITVQVPVAHGETTGATVNPGGTDVYVFVQCYAPDFGGEYVYAAYFPVSADKTATIGPLASSLWKSGGASCRAQEGYFTRNGFGKWVALAKTTFTVQP